MSDIFAWNPCTVIHLRFFSTVFNAERDTALNVLVQLQEKEKQKIRLCITIVGYCLSLKDLDHNTVNVSEC